MVHETVRYIHSLKVAELKETKGTITWKSGLFSSYIYLMLFHVFYFHFNSMEEQSGFRAGRSCTDNLFVLQQILEKRISRNLSTHLIFVDLEKAYDMYL